MATLFAITALTLGLVFLRQFQKNMEQRLLLYCIFPAFVLIIHAVGFLVAKYILSSDGYEFLLADAQIVERDIWIAFIWIMLGSLLAYVTGTVFKKTFTVERRELRYVTEYITNASNVTLLCSVIMGVEGYLLLSGQYGISGIANDEGTTQVSPLAQLMPPLINCLGYVGGYMLQNKRRRTLALMLIVTQVPYAFLAGRRALFVALISVLFGQLLAGADIFRASPGKKVVAAFLGFLVFIGGFQFYQVIRDSKIEGATGAQNIAFAINEGVHRITQETKSEEDYKKNSQYNALTRAFYIGYPAMLMKNGATGAGSNGAILIESIKLAIPRLVWRGKAAYMEGEASEEYFAYIAFRLPRFQDESNTIFTTGYTEFKLPGLLVYVFIMYFIAGAIIVAARYVGSPWIFLYAIFAETYIFVTIESCISDWIVLFRNVVLLLAPLVFLLRLGSGNQPAWVKGGVLSGAFLQRAAGNRKFANRRR